MPTSTVPSSATDTDFTMPRSVIGRWISGSDTVARAALTASSAGVVMIHPDYVAAGAASARQPRAALHQRQQPLLQEQRLDGLRQIVVGSRVARIALDPRVARPGEQHHRQGCSPRLAAQQADHLDAGE